MLQRLVAVVIALSRCLAVAAVQVRAQYRDDYDRGRREHREHERWQRERWERGYGYDRRYPLPGYYAPPPVYYAPRPGYYARPPVYAPPGVGLFLPFR